MPKVKRFFAESHANLALVRNLTSELGSDVNCLPQSGRDSEAYPRDRRIRPVGASM